MDTPPVTAADLESKAARVADPSIGVYIFISIISSPLNYF